MGIAELLLTAVGLSMDAFAVALCKGLNMSKLNIKRALVIGLFFGGFQALMPLLGWLLGTSFARYITGFDHWIAFALLVFIGGKMIYEVFKKDACEDCGEQDAFDIKELFLLAVATSIDALAAGLTFAFLKVSILQAVSLIGVTTFLLSLGGVALGFQFGALFKKKAELAGGVVLVLIGVKILLQHLALISF